VKKEPGGGKRPQGSKETKCKKKEKATKKRDIMKMIKELVRPRNKSEQEAHFLQSRCTEAEARQRFARGRKNKKGGWGIKGRN